MVFFNGCVNIWCIFIYFLQRFNVKVGFLIKLKEKSMINTTTHNIDGKEIKEYLGVVTGEAISGANFVKDFLASIKDFTGGRSGAYEEELSKARNIAFDEMNQKAKNMGANAVVGIDIDYGTLGDTGSMLMVSVNGTAIKY
tara:strand:- start:23 stop:445 length:423 start_codon:yes stop_codon:yes gene_type:complete